MASLLNWECDGRTFAQGLSLTLGMFSKGGPRGLTRHTLQHVNVCRILNRMVSAVCPRLEWSSLTLTLNNKCSPHVDKANRSGQSLLIGLSHHDSGKIWIANSDGNQYAELGDAHASLDLCMVWWQPPCLGRILRRTSYEPFDDYTPFGLGSLNPSFHLGLGTKATGSLGDRSPKVSSRCVNAHVHCTA